MSAHTAGRKKVRFIRNNDWMSAAQSGNISGNNKDCLLLIQTHGSTRSWLFYGRESHPGIIRPLAVILAVNLCTFLLQNKGNIGRNKTSHISTVSRLRCVSEGDLLHGLFSLEEEHSLSVDEGDILLLRRVIGGWGGV